MTVDNGSLATLPTLLKTLKLPAFADFHEETAVQAERQGWGFTAYLHQLAELEVEERKRRRVGRNLRSSGLPLEKSLATLELSRFATRIRHQFARMQSGDFLEQAENVLAFGLPGTGKTHLLCALGHELVQSGKKVLFIPAYRLVQRLLAAKRDLVLDKELGKLDRFDAVILDDIGYIQQDPQEMEVLFTFLAERYERRTVMITSNLVFSQWDQIFKNPMTTAAAIDRLVHHATILELRGASYRTEVAKQRNAGKKKEKQVVQQTPGES